MVPSGWADSMAARHTRAFERPMETAVIASPLSKGRGILQGCGVLPGTQGRLAYTHP